MTKNPFINALCATIYIIFGVMVMTFVTSPLRNKPDTIFAPIVVLSLLTLTAAVMAYLFFYQPVILLIDGKKKEAVKLFVQTVGIFAAFTAIALILLFLGIV